MERIIFENDLNTAGLLLGLIIMFAILAIPVLLTIIVVVAL